jgi:hypothetical protein
MTGPPRNSAMAELMSEIALLVAALARSDALSDQERAQLLAALQGKSPAFVELSSEQWGAKCVER